MVGAAGWAEGAAEEVLTTAAGFGAAAAASSLGLVCIDCVHVLFVEGHSEEVLRDLFVEGYCRGGGLLEPTGTGAARCASGGGAAEGRPGHLL